jgi:hypothetical protein
LTSIAFSFSFLFFSLSSSISTPDPLNFQSNLLNYFFLQIWSMFFWLLFILFEIIYKLNFIFNFTLLYLFYLLDLIPIILMSIYFIRDNF